MGIKLLYSNSLKALNIHTRIIKYMESWFPFDNLPCAECFEYSSSWVSFWLMIWNKSITISGGGEGGSPFKFSSTKCCSKFVYIIWVFCLNPYNQCGKTFDPRIHTAQWIKLTEENIRDTNLEVNKEFQKSHTI